MAIGLVFSTADQSSGLVSPQQQATRIAGDDFCERHGIVEQPAHGRQRRRLAGRRISHHRQPQHQRLVPGRRHADPHGGAAHRGNACQH
jgi:hypothetical protein